MAAFPWKARAKKAAIWVGAILVYFAAVYWFLYLGLRPVADFWVSTIFKNAPEPLDEELPVTVTAFRPAANVVSTIGGKGEGLNCSMPWGIDMAFAKRNDREATIPVRQRFRQACVFHDLCYRHGLATYGYSQNDCDELLQEHALRICISISPGSTLNECQIDAKKVAAGVKIGGFNSYQGWGNATHFEFDPNPYRATRFSAVRAVDHPFKKSLGNKLADEPDQLLMKFDVLRAGVRLKCVNCAQRQPHAEELDLAKASNLTGLLKSRHMNVEREVWLPPSRLFAAPHIMSGEAGSQVLVWVTRQSLTNTDACIVAIEPANLLTDTRPRDEGCRRGANERVSLTQVDLLSSAPQLSNLQAPGIVLTGLTVQNKGARLEICVSHNVRSSPSDTNRKCHVLNDKMGIAISGSDRLEAFQNFPIVRGGSHIYLSRTLPRKGRIESVDTGRVLAFDVEHDHMPSSVKPPSPIALRNRRFEISDAYDPMMPITFDPADMRMISAKRQRSWWASWFGSSEGVLEFYEVDLKVAEEESFQASGAISTADPSKVIKPRLIPLQDASGSAGLTLHGSWARRPIQVIETGTGSEPATQLLLSRSAMLPAKEEAPAVYATKTKTESPRRQATSGTSSRDVVENTRFQIAIFERPAAETKTLSPFKLARGLTCHISYTVLRVDEDRVKPCQRTVSMVGSERATPATMLRGAQLLYGRFTKGDDLPLALFDTCLPTRPIMIAAGTSIAPPDRNLRREVSCVPVKDAKELTEPLVEPTQH
jgi:hypothetical protein